MTRERTQRIALAVESLEGREFQSGLTTTVVGSSVGSLLPAVQREAPKTVSRESVGQSNGIIAILIGL